MNNITLTWMVAMFYVNDAWSNNCFLDTFLNKALRSSEMICVLRERTHRTRANPSSIYGGRSEGTWNTLVFLEDILL